MLEGVTYCTGSDKMEELSRGSNERPPPRGDGGAFRSADEGGFGVGELRVRSVSKRPQRRRIARKTDVDTGLLELACSTQSTIKDCSPDFPMDVSIFFGDGGLFFDPLDLFWLSKGSHKSFSRLQSARSKPRHCDSTCSLLRTQAIVLDQGYKQKGPVSRRAAPASGVRVLRAAGEGICKRH